MGMVNPETGRIDSLEEREFEKVQKGYTYFEENDVLFAKITPCMENGNTVIAKGLKMDLGLVQLSSMFLGLQNILMRVTSTIY